MSSESDSQSNLAGLDLVAPCSIQWLALFFLTPVDSIIAAFELITGLIGLGARLTPLATVRLWEMPVAGFLV